IAWLDLICVGLHRRNYAQKERGSHCDRGDASRWMLEHCFLLVSLRGLCTLDTFKRIIWHCHNKRRKIWKARALFRLNRIARAFGRNAKCVILLVDAALAVQCD